MDCLVPSSPWLPFKQGTADRFCEGGVTTKRFSLADDADASSLVGVAVCSLSGAGVVLAVNCDI